MFKAAIISFLNNFCLIPVLGQSPPLPSNPCAQQEARLSPVMSDASNLTRNVETRKAHKSRDERRFGRPRGYGPEGESDSPRAGNKPDTEFSRKLKEFKAKRHAPAVPCSSSSSGIPTPLCEQTSQSVVNYSTEHVRPLALRSGATDFHEPASLKLIVDTREEHAPRHSPLSKHSDAPPSREHEPLIVFPTGHNKRPYTHSPFAVDRNSQSQEAGPSKIVSNDDVTLQHKQRTSQKLQSNPKPHAEHVFTYKPLTARSRTAHSPALSVMSCESEHYSDLPSVIRVSPEAEDVKLGENSICFVNRTSPHDVAFMTSPNKPVLQGVWTRRHEGKVGRLAREKPLKGSPSLPSKPRVNVDKRHTNEG